MLEKTIGDGLSVEFVPPCARLVQLDTPQAVEFIYLGLKQVGYYTSIADVCGVEKARLITAINSYCKDDLATADTSTLQAIGRLIDDYVACVVES